MDIKKRKNVAKRIRPTRDATDSDNDSGSDSGPEGVVRPGEPRKRKREPDAAHGAFKKKAASSNPNAAATIAESETAAATAAAANGNGEAAAKKDAEQQQPPKVGPVKTQSAIRMTTFTDFAPDVCKDYKKTGFCGFGDSCKFLHAREDYKQGWALDEQWDKATAKDGPRSSGTVVASAGSRAAGAVANDAERGSGGAGDEDEAERKMLEKIPFACTICEGSYKNPIVTKCGHYFCEACALKRYRKTPSCAVCGAGTNGVFNGAKKLKELLRKKKEREASSHSAEVT